MYVHILYVLLKYYNCIMYMTDRWAVHCGLWVFEKLIDLTVIS